MEYQEYLKKLGIETNDKEKEKKLKNFIIVQLREFYERYGQTNIDKAVATWFFKENCIDCNIFLMLGIIQVFDREKDIKKIMLYYSSFLNIIKNHIDSRIYDYMIIEFENTLRKHKLNYKLLTDNDGAYLLLINNTELDEKLISEPMEWLEKYPDIRKQAIDALQTYYNSDDNIVSEVVDRFRKLLEQFMQTYFNSKAALKSLIGKYGSKLKEVGVSIEIASEFEKILNLYDMYNNNHAKHHKDAADYDVEYIMYETFNIIRLLLQIEDKRR